MSSPPQPTAFDTVRRYLLDLQLDIVDEDEAEALVVVDAPERGLHHLVIDCEAPILVIEQLVMAVPETPGDLFRRLLQMNHTLVHGAFVLDEAGRHVLFRDTLQLENLDRNELEASIAALSLALAEHGAELLRYARRPPRPAAP